ncbi:diguanylate cyclase [Aeromonas sp. RU39B]|uniref:sensor domain-containing diguanylate cyclase n=1 Tax=Aeromonas sp. RU39B TaxID=1907416 RepID=UPI000954DC24|nr:diguanylate cyclase [Aeromonas sp. RU39B]SIQ93956.1 diguanylate cyclase [Aeromonas sp. RU39B]
MPSRLWTDKRKLVWLLSLLLLSAFFLISWSSYRVAHNSLREQIETNTLPLTSDNIYSEIQQDLLRPIFISSLMSHDTFVRDWAMTDEQNPAPMIRYLKEIQDRFGTITSFYVSDKTRRYYHSTGLLKTISQRDPADAWYFRVRDLTPGEEYEINIDTDTADRTKTNVFVNYRVYDFDKGLIGVTGVGLGVDKVKQLIEKYQQRYNRTVYFVDSNGKVTLHGSQFHGAADLHDDPALSPLATRILTSPSSSFQYERNGRDVYLNSRLVPEFKWYLMVEQTEHESESTLQTTLLGNLLVSALVTLAILVVANLTLGRYQRRLEQMASTDKLTGTLSRQVFQVTFDHALSQAQRQQQVTSILLMDIDHFKQINDKFGHEVGDMVLRRVAQEIRSTLRASDILCRWGGEEFIAVLVDCDGLACASIGNKIREAVAAMSFEVNGASVGVTLSAGAAEYHDNEASLVINRADKALYRAKAEGRNRVVLST